MQSKFRDEKKEVGETGKLLIMSFKFVIKVWEIRLTIELAV